MKKIEIGPNLCYSIYYGKDTMKELDLLKYRHRYEQLRKKVGLMSFKEKIDCVFSDNEKTTLLDSNDIFIYMGTYTRAHSSKDSWYPVYEILLDSVPKEGTCGKYVDPIQYRKYRNLENGYECDIELQKCMEFEKKHIVIFIPNVRSFQNMKTFQEDYYELRRYFCKQILTMKQEEAIQKICDKEELKRIFSIDNYLEKRDISSCFKQAFEDAAIYNNENYCAKKLSLINEHEKK